MIKLIRSLLTGRNQNLTMREAIQISHFPDATVKEIPKKLGLTHAPQVTTVYPDGHEHLTFNQKTAALSRNLKKGLPKVKKKVA